MKSQSLRFLAKYKFLVVIYLLSVISYSISSSIGIDVQNLYRIPFLNIRWIDFAILIIIVGYLNNLLFKVIKHKINSKIVFLCFLYIFYEILQLFKSWGRVEIEAQISHFFCILTIFIIIDLSTFPISNDEIVHFIKTFAIWSCYVLILSNFYLLYCLISGRTILVDSDIRVGLDVIGSKESVYTYCIINLVYGTGLYFLQRRIKFWEKLVFILAILSIYLSLAYSFRRGTLISICLITLYTIVTSSNAKQILFRLTVTTLLLASGYVLFNSILSKKGYNPIDRIVQTAIFATDVKNPEWDKGRSVSQTYALNAWKKNLWTGAGYDELYHYGLPEDVATAHNGIITSLFQDGIIGTSILMLILFLLYQKVFILWAHLRKARNYESDIMRILIVISILWIIPFMTEEQIREKHSLSIQFLYLGLISNYYYKYINTTSLRASTSSTN